MGFLAGAVRIATTSTVKSSNNLFKLGVQNDETTLDGRTSKVKTCHFRLLLDHTSRQNTYFTYFFCFRLGTAALYPRL